MTRIIRRTQPVYRSTAGRRALLAVLAAVALAVVVTGSASGTDTPARNLGTVVDDASTGTAVWSNLTNGTSSNDLYITAGPATNATTHYLKATSFGFTVPTDATITGVTVNIERSQSGTASDARDASVKLVKASAVVGTDKANTTLEWAAGVDATAIYGSSADLWGTTLTPADVNSASFGVAISAKQFATAQFLRVDTITIVVSYTSGGGGTAPSNTSPPTISGSTTVGSTLTRGQGTWSGTTPITYTYQWRSCDSAGANCVNITGATATSYTIVSGDLGKTIRVNETATNSIGSATATSAQTAAITSGGGATSWTATNYSWTSFYNPGAIPYTAWTGLWKNPVDNSLWVAWTDSSGTQSVFTPQWAKDAIGAPSYPAARDHWGLTNNTTYYRTTDRVTWTQAFPNQGIADAMRTWNPTVSSCSAAGTGSNCPTIHPIPFTPQANIALDNGTIIRRVNGEDIGYDEVIKKTAFFQRLASGAGQTWSAPEYPLDPTACTCTIQISRINGLADGRLIAIGQKWAGYPRSGPAALLVMVADSNGNGWVEALAGPSSAEFAANEWDVTELLNGNLLAVFRTATNVGRKQAVLVKSGSTWTLAASAIATPPFTHSGHPEVIATSSGAVLSIATLDASSQPGIWYLSNANAQANSTAWTKLPFATGSTGTNCVAAGAQWNCSTRHYPRAIEDCYLGTCTIYVFSHSGADDDYWEVNGTAGVTQINEFILLQKFVLTSP